MSDDLLALADDLAIERARLSESMRRLESFVLRGDAGKELHRSIGAERSAGLQEELDAIHSGLGRIGVITRTLVYELHCARLANCSLLASAITVEARAVAPEGKLEVVVDPSLETSKVAADLLEQVTPPIVELVGTLVEYGIESEKERAARGKRPVPYLHLHMSPTQDGFQLRVLCDGSGIEPPFVRQHGLTLARAGVAASFQGRPGRWSAWYFQFPAASALVRCVPVRSGQRWFALPAWAVRSVRPADRAESAGGPEIRVNDRLERAPVESTQSSPEDQQKSALTVELIAGTSKVFFLVDEFLDAREVLVKPMSEQYDAGGRYLGLIAADYLAPRPEGSCANRQLREMHVMMSPAYLVYGAEALRDDASDSGREPRRASR